MQTQQPQAQTAALELQGDGLTVRLSFSLARPEFSTLLAERPLSDATLSTDHGHAEPLVVELATASAPALLQAFEQAQSALLLSLANLQKQQLDQLRDGHITAKRAA